MPKSVRSSGRTVNNSRLRRQRSGIGVAHPDYPLDLIEENVIDWLESEFAPPTYTPEQFDELDRLTEAWVQDHKRKAKAAEKRSRTRHS
jgi:hypothetical protein